MIDVNKRKKRHVFELQYNFCPQCGKKLSFIKSESKKILHCFVCGFSYWNNPRPVVSALLVDEKKVLLIKRTGDVYKNYWALPGGVIDYMEDPEKAVAREVLEETGLIIDEVKIFDAYLIVYAPKGLTQLPSHTSIDIVYKVEAKSRSPSNLVIKPTIEASQIKFFDYDRLPQRIAFGHRKIINKFRKQNNENLSNRRNRLYRKPSYKRAAQG